MNYLYTRFKSALSEKIWSDYGKREAMLPLSFFI